MREILFKAKRVDNGKWVVGNLISASDGRRAISETSGNWELYTCFPKTICQFTGLYDKNGKRIWKNDILMAHLDESYPEDVTYETVE